MRSLHFAHSCDILSRLVLGPVASAAQVKKSEAYKLICALHTDLGFTKLQHGDWTDTPIMRSTNQGVKRKARNPGLDGQRARPSEFFQIDEIPD